LQVNDALSIATEIINKSHVGFICDFVVEQIGNIKKIGVVGVSYKPGTPVTEESPGIAIIKELLAKGFEVNTWDDEGAVVKSASEQLVFPANSLELLIERSDFIVLTRPFDDVARILETVKQSGKPWLDLWRQKY
jgi:UDPglucose 6-dehydrogenase